MEEQKSISIVRYKQETVVTKNIDSEGGLTIKNLNKVCQLEKSLQAAAKNTCAYTHTPHTDTHRARADDERRPTTATTDELHWSACAERTIYIIFIVYDCGDTTHNQTILYNDLFFSFLTNYVKSRVHCPKFYNYLPSCEVSSQNIY